jgi:hypothetical protein
MEGKPAESLTLFHSMNLANEPWKWEKVASLFHIPSKALPAALFRHLCARNST